jgi:hypothetical protein
MEAPRTETRELPEHERLHKIADKSQEIGTFLNWLDEQGIYLSREHRHTDACWSNECRLRDGQLTRYYEPIQKLLARFYGIDLDKLEREKREILADIRKQRASRQIDKELGL